MANVKISELPAASAMTAGAQIPAVISGVTDYVTGTQILAFIQSGISTGITIDTTAITGGTTLRILYDNAGTVGETPNTYITNGFAFAGDTGLSRISAGVVGVGNGTAADITGKMQGDQYYFATAMAGDGGDGAAFEMYNSAAAAKARTTTSRQNIWTNTRLVNPSDFFIGWASFAAGVTGTDVFNASDTGLSRISAGVVGIGNGTAGNATGTLQLGAGSSSAPAVAYGAETNTGMFFASGTIIFDITGFERARVTNGNQVGVRSNGVFAWDTDGTFASYDTGLVRVSAGIVAVGNGSIGDTSGFLRLGAGTTAAASLNIPHGSAPTSPVNGDIWTTTSGLFVRINGSTVGPLT